MILFYDLKRGVFKNIFEGVAKAFPSSKLVFAQYDCHKHDPPAPFADIHHDKVHYPAVYYYRQGHGKVSGPRSQTVLAWHLPPLSSSPRCVTEPEKYAGRRQTTDYIDWIQNHPHIKHAEL